MIGREKSSLLFMRNNKLNSFCLRSDSQIFLLKTKILANMGHHIALIATAKFSILHNDKEIFFNVLEE